MVESTVPERKAPDVLEVPRIRVVDRNEKEARLARVIGVVLRLVDFGEEPRRWNRLGVRVDEKLVGIVAAREVEAGVHGTEREARRVVPAPVLRVPWRVRTLLLNDDFLLGDLRLRLRAFLLDLLDDEFLDDLRLQGGLFRAREGDVGAGVGILLALAVDGGSGGQGGVDDVWCVEHGAVAVPRGHGERVRIRGGALARVGCGLRARVQDDVVVEEHDADGDHHKRNAGDDQSHPRVWCNRSHGYDSNLSQRKTTSMDPPLKSVPEAREL